MKSSGPSTAAPVRETRPYVEIIEDVISALRGAENVVSQAPARAVSGVGLSLLAVAIVIELAIPSRLGTVEYVVTVLAAVTLIITGLVSVGSDRGRVVRTVATALTDERPVSLGMKPRSRSSGYGEQRRSES